MLKQLLTLFGLVFSIACLSASAQTPSFEWVGTADPSISSRSLDVVVDHNGDVIAVGRVRGTADFGTGSPISVADAVFVSKYPGGAETPSWVTTADSTGSSGGSNSGQTSALGVAVDTGNNIYVSGRYIGSIDFGSPVGVLPVGGANEEGFVAKFDPNGQLLWAKAVTGSFSVLPWDIAVDGGGNAYIVGQFAHSNLGGNISFGPVSFNTFGGTDLFIAKYDENGVFQWARRAGSSTTGTFGGELFFAVSVDQAGNVVAGGRFSATANFSGTLLTSSGQHDRVLAKYDPLGNLLWASRDGTANSRDNIAALALTGTGEILATGPVGALGAEDLYVAR